MTTAVGLVRFVRPGVIGWVAIVAAVVRESNGEENSASEGSLSMLGSSDAAGASESGSVIERSGLVDLKALESGSRGEATS